MRVPRLTSQRFGSSPFRSFVRLSVLSRTAALILAATAIPYAAPSTLLTSNRDFDARGMLQPGSFPGAGGGTGSSGSAIRFGEPGRFAMHQSYSLTAMSGSNGSSSSGLYLNTLTYRLSSPLTVFADVGFYSPIHSTMPGAQEGGPGSLVLPRMGLEYKPTERLTMNLELVNGPDAWKAYGGMPWSSHSTPGSLGP